MSKKKEQHIEYFGCSLGGLRDENQDAFIVKYPNNQDEFVYKGMVACIADGVSCSHHGQQASHTATTQFVTDYYATPLSWSVKRAASELLKGINTWLYSQGKDQLSHNGMVTTFSSIIMKSNTCYLFHVGDSRIYLYRDNTLTLLTRDHQRANFGQQHYLTRALGMDDRIDIDFQTLLLEKDDQFILTTDGIHDILTQDDLTQHLSQSKSAETLCHTLCSSALDKGSLDNVSCVVLHVHSLPMRNRLEHQQTLLSRNILPALNKGQTIDHFEIIKTLYDGSRSHIYLALDKYANEKRVIKAPSMNYLDDPDTLERFANEYWIASQLHSHRVMTLFPYVDSSLFLYQVCEYIEGITLRQWMYDNPTPPLEKVRILLHEIVRAIRVFQRADMVHRDLKPENIMITNDHEVKIIDFGAVDALGLSEAQREKIETLPLGSVNYTAPEYIDSGKATTLSDLFSIAVIGYEMISGKYPYEEHSQQSIQQARHIKWQYHSIREYRHDIPLWIDLAFQKATAEKPNHRYPALGDFITDLFTPNLQLLNRVNNKPLMKRDPILFWKIIAFSAIIIVIIEGLLLI